MKISDRKMSVVIVIADAFGAMHSSIAGYERDTTPFIKDFFSKGSLIYANARSNAPWTLPSFASFLRSRLPREIITKELFSDEGALPKILYEHDIPVISFLRKPTFTIFESIANAFESSNRSFFDYKNYEDPFDVAVENINNSKKPSLFFIHDTTPHSPYIPPEAYRTLFGGKGNELDQGPIPDRNYLVNLHNTYVPHEEKERLRLLYDQKLRYLDDLFKAFILNLSPDVLEKTVVIFAADHGESFGEHRNSFHHGLTLYDELLRIPLYVKIPGQLQQTIQQPVSMLDLAPTILNFFNIPVPASYKGAVLPTENISGIQRRNVQCDGGKVLSFNVRGLLSKIPTENLTRPIINPLPSVAIIEDDLKLYVSKGFKEEVYDLIKDPFETNDLFISNPSKARGFAHKHLEKIASTTISLHYLNRINLDNTWQVRMYARDSEMAQLEWRDIIGKKFLDSQRKHHQMILLVEKYPYFLTAYIEILEFLYKHNPKWHTAFLTYTNDRLRRFLFGNNFPIHRHDVG